MNKLAECVEISSHNHLNRNPNTLTDNELIEIEIYIEESQRDLNQFYYRSLEDPNGHAFGVDEGYDVRTMIEKGHFKINMDLIRSRLQANGGHPTVPVLGTNKTLLEYLQTLDIQKEDFSIDPAHYTEWLVDNLYVKECLKCNRTSRNHLNNAVDTGVIALVRDGGMYKQKVFSLAKGLQ